MKTQILLIAAAIAVSASLNSISAQDINDDTLSVSRKPQARIHIDSNNLVAILYRCQFEDKRRRLVVRIYDEAGNRIHYRPLKQQGSAIIRFDLSQCDDGIYDVGIYEKSKPICSRSIRKETKVHTTVLMSAL